eukprot:NODE_312_length_10013_cov_0.697801.p8 type:complete len:110 gc:universal NODE_312_length_10013_cov_0.697801:8819-9148(+)
MIFALTLFASPLAKSTTNQVSHLKEHAKCVRQHYTLVVNQNKKMCQDEAVECKSKAMNFCGTKKRFKLSVEDKRKLSECVHANGNAICWKAPKPHDCYQEEYFKCYQKF